MSERWGSGCRRFEGMSIRSNGRELALKPMISTLVDASLDACCIVDRNLRLLHANASYMRLSGLKYRDLRGKEMHGLCHERFQLGTCQEESGCVVSRAIAGRRPFRVDEVYSGNHDLCLNVVAIPLFDDAGEVYAVIEQYRDVTAESRMQRNYKQLLDYQRRQNEILKDEVGLRTRQLEETNSELQAALRRVEQLARTDGLTELYNRRHFEEIFSRELVETRHRARSLALILFDLDHFKKVNDVHGHVVGDTVLKRFAEVLVQCSRSTDIVARIGGEEFTVLLPNIGPEDAMAYCDRVRRRLAESGFMTTTSAGIAVLPFDGISKSELFESADRALYAAKAAGRNRALHASRLQPIQMSSSA